MANANTIALYLPNGGTQLFRIDKEQAGDCGFIITNSIILEKIFGDDFLFLMNTCNRPTKSYTNEPSISHCSMSENPDKREKMNSTKLKVNKKSFDCKYVPKKILNP